MPMTFNHIWLGLFLLAAALAAASDFGSPDLRREAITRPADREVCLAVATHCAPELAAAH